MTGAWCRTLAEMFLLNWVTLLRHAKDWHWWCCLLVHQVIIASVCFWCTNDSKEIIEYSAIYGFRVPLSLQFLRLLLFRFRFVIVLLRLADRALLRCRGNRSWFFHVVLSFISIITIVFTIFVGVAFLVIFLVVLTSVGLEVKIQSAGGPVHENKMKQLTSPRRRAVRLGFCAPWKPSVSRDETENARQAIRYSH